MKGEAMVDLAAAGPFRIGAMIVEPALRQIRTAPDRTETLEPRVMRVLVVLARADGSIVGRDALVRQCWEGRIVGDDSINRTISRLRRLAETMPGKSFRIETIAKVGYRLIGPVECAIPDTAPPPETPAPSVAASPFRQRGMVACAVAIGVSAVLAVLAVRAFGTRGPPVVEVESFTVTAPGVPPGLVAEMRAETADFLANEKFYSVTVPREPGGARPDWRVRGTIAPADNGSRVVVFAELLRQGSDVAVAQLRIDRAVGQPMLARSLGLRIGRTSGCILLTVTNPELTGGFSEAALPALAASCITWHDKTSSVTARIESFRDTALALPRSAYHRARLGEMLGDLAADGAANAAALRRQGAAFVANAEAIDPTQPHIFLARARLLPTRDFAGREALYRQALAGRPSDCACEFGDYSIFLSSVGRNADARTYAARAREKQPKNIPWLRRVGEASAVAGDFDAARSELAAVAGYLPDPSSLDDWRMNLGIWSQDWKLADAMAQRQPDSALRSFQSRLVTALASGSAARIAAAGQALIVRSESDTGSDRPTVTALAMSGEASVAVAAADRLLQRQPTNLSLLFEPSFGEARRTPAFAALSEKLGLTEYWRRTGRPPDFCRTTDAPAMCKGLRRAG